MRSATSSSGSARSGEGSNRPHRPKGVAVPLARTHKLELLDQLDHQAPVDALRGNLRDIRRANRWFGGTRAVVTTLAPLLRTQDATVPLSILDVATGSADIPIALAGWAQHE